jgi:hypothetical protein
MPTVDFIGAATGVIREPRDLGVKPDHRQAAAFQGRVAAGPARRPKRERRLLWQQLKPFDLKRVSAIRNDRETEMSAVKFL